MEICFAANSTEYNCVFDFLFVLGQNEVTFDTVIKLNSIMFKWVNFIRKLFLFWIIILNYYICLEYYFCFELLFLFRILFLFCYYICFVIISVFLLFLFVIFCFELVHITFSWPIFALHFFSAPTNFELLKFGAKKLFSPSLMNIFLHAFQMILRKKTVKS